MQEPGSHSGPPQLSTATGNAANDAQHDDRAAIAAQLGAELVRRGFTLTAEVLMREQFPSVNASVLARISAQLEAEKELSQASSSSSAAGLPLLMNRDVARASPRLRKRTRSLDAGEHAMRPAAIQAGKLHEGTGVDGHGGSAAVPPLRLIIVDPEIELPEDLRALPEMKRQGRLAVAKRFGVRTKRTKAELIYEILARIQARTTAGSAAQFTYDSLDRLDRHALRKLAPQYDVRFELLGIELAALICNKRKEQKDPDSEYSVLLLSPAAAAVRHAHVNFPIPAVVMGQPVAHPAIGPGSSSSASLATGQFTPTALPAPAAYSMPAHDRGTMHNCASFMNAPQVQMAYSVGYPPFVSWMRPSDFVAQGHAQSHLPVSLHEHYSNRRGGVRGPQSDPSYEADEDDAS